MYVDMDDGVRVTLMETTEMSVKKGGSLSIPLSFTVPPTETAEIAAWVLACGLGSTNGLNFPVVVHMQGYYLDDMVGGLVEVGLDIALAKEAVITVSTGDKTHIEGSVSNIGSGLTGFLPASGTASVCGADGVSVLDCSFTKSGATVNINSETPDGKGIVEAIKACAAANDGKLVLKTNVAGYEPMTFNLTAAETEELIGAITVAVDKTLEALA